MNFHWLESYITVVKEGGVAPAARTMYISPQALLQQINLLEKEVGFQLLHRTSAGMTPTEAGQAFYRECTQLLTSWTHALTTCRSIASRQSVLRLPMMNSVTNPDSTELVCTRYRQLDPTGPEVRYIITSQPNDTWIDGLLDNRFDIIKWYRPLGQEIPGVYFEKLSDVTSVCICRADHPLASLNELKLSDLDGQRVGTNSIKLAGGLRQRSLDAGISLDLELVASDRYAIAEACDRGCICLMDRRIASSFASLGYQAIPLLAPPNLEVGFACMEEKVAQYAGFFEAVRQERAIASTYGARE